MIVRPWIALTAIVLATLCPQNTIAVPGDEDYLGVFHYGVSYCFGYLY